LDVLRRCESHLGFSMFYAEIMFYFTNETQFLRELVIDSLHVLA